jgi:hypothetical protein
MKNILITSNFGFTKWCVAFIAAGWMGAAQAQVTITPGATVTQNFSSLGVNATATLPSGWKASKSANAREVTAYSTAVTAVERAGGINLSTTAGNGIYNFGSSDTDRAVGGLSSGSASKSVNLYVAIQNTGGSSIPSFSISYKAERYRNGSNTAGFSIQMYYSTDGTTWTSAGSSFLSSFAANADNNGAATVPIETKNVTSQALANSLAAGSTLYLAWNYSVTSGTTTSNAQALGVSDIEIVAAGGGGGTPPTITGISPSSGLADTIVTITGTDFTGATAVSFNGVAAASYTVDSATSITATAPTGVTTGPISVTTPGGTAASSGNFTVPALAIAVPSSIIEGDSGQIATVTATPAPTSDLTITLTSSSATDLTVDGGTGAGATSTATIAANTTEASFFLNAPADSTVDNDASVNLTATAASGYRSATAIVTVRNVDIAPVSITTTGTTYTQNFDELGTGNVTGAFSSTLGVQRDLGSVTSSMVGLGGWYVAPIGGSGPGTSLTANDGSISSGGVFSHGTTGASDRALGLNASGSSVFAFGAAFKNDTGVTIESFTLAFSAENWRGTTAASKLTFGYGKLGGDIIGGNFLSATGTGVTTLASADITGDSQSSTAALDGNTVKKSVNVTLTISVAPGESLFLRWRDSDDAGNDAALAIDDFSLTANATVITTPPSLTGVTVDQPSLTPTQATVSSQVVTDGGTSLTGQGFVFSPTATSADPTLSTVGALSVTNTPALGAFTNNLTNLTAGTAYTVKSYAINSAGTNYSSPAALTTLAAYPTFTGEYRQNFDNVTNNALIPAGWRSLSSSNINSFVGYWTNTNASTGGLYGRDGAPGILGYLHTGGTGILTNKLTLVNGTGGTLTNLYVSYTGEVNLTNNGRSPAFAVAVNGTDVAELAYSTLGGTNSSVSSLVANLNITTNDQITITWVSDRGTGSGSSKMIGLTDVRVATTAPSTAPTITSTNAFSGTVGVAFSNTITASGSDPIAFSGTDLPGGLSVATNGVISGTPTAAGTFTNAVLTATNAAGTNNQTATFTIAKGTPSITAVPTASAITDGQALSASVLSGGTASVAGAFSWTTPSTVPAVGTATYGVTFTPTDTANYNTATTTVSLTVNPAGTTYSGWLNGAGASDAAFLDYVFGAATPGTLDPSLRPTVAVTGGNLVLTYNVRQGTSGLTVTPKTSADLAAGPSGWVTDGVTVDNVGTATTVNGVSVQQKTASVPVSGAKKFLRVEAVQE